MLKPTFISLFVYSLYGFLQVTPWEVKIKYKDQLVDPMFCEIWTAARKSDSDHIWCMFLEMRNTI